MPGMRLAARLIFRSWLAWRRRVLTLDWWHRRWWGTRRRSWCNSCWDRSWATAKKYTRRTTQSCVHGQHLLKLRFTAHIHTYDHLLAIMSSINGSTHLTTPTTTWHTQTLSRVHEHSQSVARRTGTVCQNQSAPPLDPQSFKKNLVIYSQTVVRQIPYVRRSYNIDTTPFAIHEARCTHLWYGLLLRTDMKTERIKTTYGSGPKFTDDLRTILRQFAELRQSYDNWRIHRTFMTISRPIFRQHLTINFYMS